VGNLLIYLWAVLAPGARESLETLEILATVATMLNVAGLVIFPTTPIVYLMWLHRVVRQLNAWGRDVEATPAWAVGSWFVPFVNLVKPFRVVRSIVAELGGAPLAASLHLGVWWGAFILSRILERIAARLTMRLLPPSLALKVYLVVIGSSLCTIAAAFLCARIVREVQERLESRRSGRSIAFR
jgi:hypothetical protein